MAPSEHPYHRSLAPTMWVFVALATLELAIVHFLLALWDWRVALLVSLLSLAGLAWLILAIRSFRRLPVLMDHERILFRTGRIARIEVPIANIRAVRTRWDGPEVKRPDVRNLALIAYPNILVDLAEPIRAGRRSVRAVAHRFDDPAAFVLAFDAARGRKGP